MPSASKTRYTQPTRLAARSASAEPRCGVPMVVRLSTRRAQAESEISERASSPPMLCPMMCTGSSPKAASIRSASLRARTGIPAVAGTRVTSTRFPSEARNSGISWKYHASVKRPTPIRLKPKSPCASTIGEFICADIVGASISVSAASASSPISLLRAAFLSVSSLLRYNYFEAGKPRCKSSCEKPLQPDLAGGAAPIEDNGCADSNP